MSMPQTGPRTTPTASVMGPRLVLGPLLLFPDTGPRTTPTASVMGPRHWS